MVRIKDVEQRALQRVRDAEIEAAMRMQENEAAEAYRGSIQSYKAYLDQIEELSAQQKAFLAELSLSGIISQACFKSGTPPRTCYGWQTQSADFKELVAETKKFANDRLEQVAIDLATGAYMRPLVSQGRIAGYERIFDTKALLALLKARKPEQFSQRIDVTSNGHSLVKLIDREAWDSVIILMIFGMILTLMSTGLSGMTIAA